MDTSSLVNSDSSVAAGYDTSKSGSVDIFGSDSEIESDSDSSNDDCDEVDKQMRVHAAYSTLGPTRKKQVITFLRGKFQEIIQDTFVSEFNMETEVY